MKERNLYKKKIDMYKVKLITNETPCTIIGVNFFQSMPQVGEVIYHHKDYYIHNLRHYSNITYLWVEDVSKKPEENARTFTELAEQLSLFQEDKSFMDKIKEKCKEVASLLDKVK